MGRRRLTSAVLFAILLVAVAVRCMRSDELHCENAVAQLQRCCTDFRVGAEYCAYRNDCADTFAYEKTYPAISEDDARCIVNASCATLVAGGTCARALAAQPLAQGESSNLCP